MSLVIEENKELKEFTTFRMGGKAHYFAHINTTSDLEEYVHFASGKKLQIIVIGGGSNIILDDKVTIDACVAHMQIKGITIAGEDDNFAYVNASVGEIWDDVVSFSVNEGLSGIEAMSAIPGLVGGTPVQNVGAYGQEIEDTLTELTAYDLKTSSVVTILNKDCQFAYRDSIFKHEGKGRYIILAITLKLSKAKPKMPHYPGVKKYFDEVGIEEPSLLQIRDAITKIRWTKLPDPKEVASVGSFFKNPIVSEEAALALKETYPEMIMHAVDNHEYKLGAGWMIDSLGLKGKNFGNLSLYKNNALVIVNNGNATKAELIELIAHIQDLTQKKFGVTLTPEPIFL